MLPLNFALKRPESDSNHDLFGGGAMIYQLTYQDYNLLTSINSRNKKFKHTLFFLNNCLRRRELNACGEERKAVKTRKQTNTQTYLVK